MTATVTPDGLFDCARQRKRFAKRRCLAHLYDQTGDTPSGRFLPELAEQSSQLFCAVLVRSEEHTSELQSRSDLVCRLLLEKKKKTTAQDTTYNKRLPPPT